MPLPDSTANPSAVKEILVRSGQSASLRDELAELWRHRELLWFLARRELQVRYRQAALGVAWALLQPLLSMLVFTVFLGRLAKLPSDGLPYMLFAYLGLLPWQFFANAVTAGSNSIVANERLVTKVYFPRMIVPLSAVLAAFFDLMLNLVCAAGLMLLMGVAPGPALLALPLVLLWLLLTAAGLALGLSAANVEYRDVRHAVPFALQVGMFATPVVYSILLVPERWRPLLALNPMAGVVQAMRWTLVGQATLDVTLTLVSLAVSLAIFIAGFMHFRRVERRFADRL